MTSPITVVVADDHPLMRRGIFDMLRGTEGVKVVGEAGDGEDALAAIRKLKPAIAILDLEMPGMSGLEVLRVARREQLKTTVALLTMHKDEEMFNAAFDAGALGYILKDNAVEELDACIRSIARGKPFISSALSQMLLNRARGTNPLRREHPGLTQLTPAEIRILKMIAENKTTKEIAASLGISPRTVENHRGNIAEKLGLKGSHSLLKFAYANKSKF
jgi:DNA-binding NarL/FixJ family response regulator